MTIEYLLTGSEGYIGQCLIKQIRMKNVIKFDITRDASQDVKNFHNLPKHQISRVIHLAALCEDQDSVNLPLEYFENNLRGTVNLLEYARRYDVEKFLFASSAAAINHVTPYGLSKHNSEEWCQIYHDLYGLNISILRIFNVYGSGNIKGVIHDLLKQIQNGDNLKIFGDGTQIRDYIHISDVVRSISELMEAKSNGLVEIGTGVKTSVNDIIFLLEQKLKRKFHVEHLARRIGDIDCSYAKQPYLTTFVPLQEGLRSICGVK